MNKTERTLKILLLILNNQYAYKLSEIANEVGGTARQAKNSIKALRKVKIKVDIRKYKYAVLPEEDAPQLSKLYPLSNHELAKIHSALKSVSPEVEINEADYIIKKLEVLVDIQKMGLRALRSAQLAKMNELEESKIQKKQVRLINYHSNSSGTEDRTVECFDIDPDSGTIQAFDIYKMTVRHFKIQRAERVEISDQDWQFEDRRKIQKIDDFGIANDEQEPVRLKLNSRAFNILRDTFPKAARNAVKSNEEHWYDLEVYVNENFFGIVPFILSNPGHVKIIEPYELREAVAKQARTFLLL